VSDSASIALIRRLYDSGMDPAVADEVMSPDLVWDITPGFPNSGVYHGWDNVGRDFFGPMLPNYDSFGAVAEQFYGDDAGHVFVYGHYHAVPKGRGGVNIRFIHFWTVREGKLARMVQAADSHILQQALQN
jgi:ketosteroid isomerase-like protein